jgi:hypothetical protein
METHKFYTEKMSAQLKEWNAQVNLLEAKIENTSASLKLKSKEELANLRAQQLAAMQKMHELGQSSGEAWDQIKISTDKMWEELKSGIGAAQAKFK